jgi:hypothetical protein
MLRTLLILVLTATPAAAGQLHTASLTLPVEGDAAQPSVALDPDHGFIITWIERGAAGARLMFATVSAAGAVAPAREIANSARSGAGGEAAQWFVNWADFPSLVVLDNGDWITHWLQRTAAGTYAYEIRVVRSRDRGRSWSEPIVPHRDASATEHGFVSLLPAGGDRVRLVWLDGRETAGAAHDHGNAHPGAMTLRSALLDRSGAISEESLLDASTCDCCQTDAVRRRERSVVVYRDRADDELRNMHWFVHDGEAWSTDRLLHDDGWRIAGCPVNGPALAANDSGVLALWPTMVGEAMVVRAALAREAAFAAPVTLESDSGALGRVDAAPFGIAEFLALWLGAGTEPGTSVLRLARLDAKLAQRSLQELTVLPRGRSTGVPRLAASGRVAVAVWTDVAQGRSTVRALRLSESDAAR